MYVYFAKEKKASGKIKIGNTVQAIEKRIAGLQTGNPTKIVCHLKVIGDLKREVWFHDLFHKERIISEWFDNSGVLALFLNHSWCFGGASTYSLSPDEAREQIKQNFINYKRPLAIRISTKKKYDISIHDWFPKENLVKKNFIERWLSKLICKYIYLI